MDFVKVLKLTQINLKDRKVINVTDENIVKLSGYNFLVKILETYNNKKFENNELMEAFIKINLPKQDEEKAHEQWFEGVEYNGHNYTAWFATTGGMKKEENGICDTFFIREDYKGFAELVENLISLGKFKELEKEKEICVNKDVLSRISLITSDLITEIEMPNYIILPSATFEWVKDYKTVEPYKCSEKVGNKDVEKIKYNLIDYHFDDKIDVFDGGAIATPKVFNSISKTLNRNDIDFAIIRGYGNAMKGLITKFDIIKYLNIFYKADTEFCKKKSGKYYLKDRWNEWQEVTDNTMLLNESMVKLAKYFDSMKEYTELLNKLNNEKYMPFYNLVNKLYITKVNKPDKEISEYRRLSYQVVNALALTVREYEQLATQDVKVFKKIVIPYDRNSDEKNEDKKFTVNVDYINLFYKQCINSSISEDDEDFEKITQSKLENIVDKASELINISSNFVKLNFVKNNLGTLIEKKIRDLACGKITVKAKYQYIAVDPISYMNFAITREQLNNGLLEGQFYSSDCQNEDIRTIARNPLCAYSEIHNVQFIRNTFFDNWLCQSKELIYFNQKTDILSLMSSADCDGDACTVIDSEIIRNAVVVPKDGKYFITLSDGEKKLLPYNAQNRFISTYKAAGDLISKISLKAASVNSNCQNIPDLYDTINKKFINRNELKADFTGTEEEFNDHIKEKKTIGEYIIAWNAEIELKEYIKENFYNYEKEIYIILYNAMKAIDSAKTLIFPDKKDMGEINSKYFKKPKFLKYRERREDVNDVNYLYTGGLLDFFSYRIQDILLNKIESRKVKFSPKHSLLQDCFKSDGYDKGLYFECFKYVDGLFTQYEKARNEAEKALTKANGRLFHLRNEAMNNGRWSPDDDDSYDIKRAENKKIRNKKYKEIDAKYLPIATKITNNFDLETVCQCIANLPKCTENFILSMFWSCFTYVNSNLSSSRYIYQKDENGDIEYLYEKYKKIEVKGFNNSKVVDNIIIDDKVKLKLDNKIRFKISDRSIVTEITESLENGHYELKLSDERVQAFSEFNELLEGKEVIKVVRIDKVNEKSMGLICEV